MGRLYLRCSRQFNRTAPESPHANANCFRRFSAGLVSITHQARRRSGYLCFELSCLSKKEFTDRCKLLDLFDRIVRQQSFVWTGEGMLRHRPADFGCDITVPACNQRLSEPSKRWKRIKRVPTRIQEHRRYKSSLFRTQPLHSPGDGLLTVA